MRSGCSGDGSEAFLMIVAVTETESCFKFVSDDCDRVGRNLRPTILP